MRSKNRSVIGVDRVVKCTRKLEFTVDTLNIFVAFDKDDRLESALLSSSSRFSVAALTTQFPVPRTKLDQFYSADAVSVAAKRDDSFRLTSPFANLPTPLRRFAPLFYHICRKASIASKGFTILSYLIWHTKIPIPTFWTRLFYVNGQFINLPWSLCTFIDFLLCQRVS